MVRAGLIRKLSRPKSLAEWLVNDAAYWGRAAIDLTEWTQERLVNRTDCWGAYLPLERRRKGASNNYTAPKGEDRADGALTHEIIYNHFMGRDWGNLIGLHAISPQNTSRWVVVDIDQHGDKGPATAECNFDAAVGWYNGLKERGFHPLLLDSNGAGGFHLLVVFAEPIPSVIAFAFGHWIVRDWKEQGLDHEPEVFPKQPDVNSQRRYGNWWRLPGRHHTRDHWTRVWDGERWLERLAAIDAILATTGDPPSMIPAEGELAAALPSNRLGGSSTGGLSRPAGHWLNLLQGREPGKRHETLLQLAGHLIARGVEPEVVEEICVIWNEARNRPPKAEEQIRRTVRDIVRRDQETRPQGRYRHGHLSRGDTIVLRVGDG